MGHTSCILLGSVTTELWRDSCGKRSYTRFICDIHRTYCKDQLPLSYVETCVVSCHILGSYVTYALRGLCFHNVYILEHMSSCFDASLSEKSFSHQYRIQLNFAVENMWKSIHGL